MEKFIEFLSKNKFEFYENFDLSNISTIKFFSQARVAIFPRNEDELKKILKKCWHNKIFYKVVGNASNLLFEKYLNFPIIITSKMVDEITIDGNFVTASAGISISRFCDILRKNELSGFEGLCGIPATIGGAIRNNAGAFNYLISSHLLKISVFFEGNFFEINSFEIKFGYHYSNLNGIIIISATFLFEKKKEYDILNLYNEFTYMRTISQPTGLSLGSVFQRVSGKSAGFYIERAGLKGTRVGGVVISNKHSNFFINDKSGSVTDFMRLLVLVQTNVERQFGLTLIPEIEKVGDKDENFSRLSYTYKK